MGADAMGRTRGAASVVGRPRTFAKAVSVHDESIGRCWVEGRLARRARRRTPRGIGPSWGSIRDDRCGERSAASDRGGGE